MYWKLRLPLLMINFFIVSVVFQLVADITNPILLQHTYLNIINAFFFIGSILVIYSILERMNINEKKIRAEACLLIIALVVCAEWLTSLI